MTVLQTIVVYALIPLALYGVISLLTLWPKVARGPRYRPGQDWNYEPLWWTGNPEGIGHAEDHDVERRQTPGEPLAPTAHGGARGSW